MSAIAGGISHGIYMGTYRYLLSTMMAIKEKKNRSIDQTTNTTTTALTFSETFACSVSGNFAVAILTNPIWFIKTRMQIHDDHDNGGNKIQQQQRKV